MKRNWLVNAKITFDTGKTEDVEYYFRTKGDAESWMEYYSRMYGSRIKNLKLTNLKTNKHRGYIYVFDL